MPRSGESKMYYQMLIRKSIIVLFTLLCVVLLFKFLIEHIWSITYSDPYGDDVPFPYV